MDFGGYPDRGGTFLQDKLSDRAPVLDELRRPLRDLRISLTDRCNFRCPYCMPREMFGPDHKFLSADETLTLDEILRITRHLVDLGVEKIRLTGGEPLLRPDLARVIESIMRIEGVQDIALTTNGSLLTPRRARQLADAGLRRITISLDALSDDAFRRMNDVGFPVRRVLDAIHAAKDAGLEPVKVNMVVRRGYNEQEILPMVEHFRYSGVILRFIEYMDVGTTNGWNLADVVSADEILEQISSVHPLHPVSPRVPGEVATRFQFDDGAGEIGLIHSVTKPFCGGCTRLRLTAEGDLYTCLFAARGTPLRQRLREGISDSELRQVLEQVWRVRKDAYSQHRHEYTSAAERIEMSKIGG
ncbi:GTP 3',8-cyclase MoaA [Alicyclobacillus acidiphilus]|uniref:GTP 3',8-cyclase MoaA n=1 Tax=Alicyclobacillus acidiphilus TaxID=182455 RepID=UPI001FDF1A15